MCKPIIIPEAVMKEAPRLPGQAVDDILDALSSPEKSMFSVKGRISKVYLPTNKNVGEDRIPYQDVMLKDISGKIKVTVWDKMVGTLDKGHLVELSKCRVKLFQAEKKLTTTSATTAVLFTSEDPQFDVSDDELNEDEPHQSMVDMPSGKIEAIFDVDPYLSCPKASCNNTKLTTVQEDADEVLKMLCKSCKEIFRGGASNSYMRATVLLVTGSEQKKVTLCSPQIKKLFESRGLDSKIEWDKMKMITKFMDVIPIEIKYSLRNNTVSKLLCKRIYQ